MVEEFVSLWQQLCRAYINYYTRTQLYAEYMRVRFVNGQYHISIASVVFVTYEHAHKYQEVSRKRFVLKCACPNLERGDN